MLANIHFQVTVTIFDIYIFIYTIVIRDHFDFLEVFFMIFGSSWKVQVLGEVFMCMYRSSRGESNRSFSQSELQIF